MYYIILYDLSPAKSSRCSSEKITDSGETGKWASAIRLSLPFLAIYIYIYNYLYNHNYKYSCNDIIIIIIMIITCENKYIYI